MPDYQEPMFPLSDLLDEQKRDLLKERIQMAVHDLYELVALLREVEPRGFLCTFQSPFGQPIYIEARLERKSHEY